MLRTYESPRLHGYGSMTRLTNWDNEYMYCSGEPVYFSGTWGNRGPLPPGVGGWGAHSEWYAYADDHDCQILFPNGDLVQY